ncbi:Conserved_hypothetical protein [Hexamita inflata]|uniref:Uncharacterized protein n=1 Tax=Hexamita inflata TaxID=28002 RepID=A0AA86NK31_9EUKA|nr:Conserved hypothetical protein [Hexamita inflata]
MLFGISDLIFQAVISKSFNSLGSVQICNSKLLNDGNAISFCEKHTSMVSMTSTHTVLGQRSQIFNALYTSNVQNSALNYVYSSNPATSFALFGLSPVINISQSTISVKVDQFLLQGALICLSCDVNVSASTFAFSSFGQNVSGFTLYSTSVQLSSVLIQFRLNGQNVGGISLYGVSLNIISCNITGFVIDSAVNGSLVVFSGQIQASNVRVCSNVGLGKGMVSGDLIQSCDVCGSQIASYGMCMQSLDFGNVVDNQLVCTKSFIFDGNACSCPKGWVLNISTCISLLDTSSQLINENTDLKTQISKLNQTVIDLTNLVNSQALVIIQFVNQITCASKFGYQLVNNVCVQQSCSISGQQSVNGICQCMHINAIVQGNTCACPQNSNLIENVCVCQFTGQQMINGSCQCQTQGAYLDGSNICTCGSSVNVSNVCTCPQGQVLQFGVCVCLVQFAYLQGNTCVCPLNAQVVDNSCKCPDNSDIIGTACVCKISGMTIFNNQCQCATGQLVNGICQYVLSDPSFTCSQQLFFYSFDVSSVTNTISNGYVFGTDFIVTGAYVDIQDNVYHNNVVPLFLSQTTFNNVKIRVGVQSITGGTLLSPSTQITINQLNIISKDQTQITLTQGQLNIMQAQLSNANITTLLLNMSFSMSAGNITMFGSLQINSIVNITNYQILGVYQSSASVALISLLTANSSINMTNINIQPYVFIIGNYSSLLFSSVTYSKIVINNIAILIGTSSNVQQLSQIATKDTLLFNYGGIVMYQLWSSLTLSSLIYDCYQSVAINNATNIGSINGQSIVQNNNQDTWQIKMILQNSCVHHQINSSMYVTNMGLFGWHCPQMTIQNSQIALYLQMTYFENIGTIGRHESVQCYIQDSVIQFTNLINAGQDLCVSSIIGYQNMAASTYIQRTTVKNSNFTAQWHAGGIIGNNYNGPQHIIDCVIQYNKIRATSYIGGVVGYTYYCNIQMSGTLIQSNELSGSWCGIFQGYSGNKGTTYDIQTSTSIGNNLNGQVMPECTHLTNAINSITQC